MQDLTYCSRKRNLAIEIDNEGGHSPSKRRRANSVIDFTDDERLEYLREKPDLLADVLRPRPYEDVPICGERAIIPAPIAQYLKPYQIEGAEFLFDKYMHQHGCILGDDMGLGKTIQVIAFLTAAFGKTGDERDAKRMRKMRKEGESYPKVLIICPSALMANWANELDCGRIRRF